MGRGRRKEARSCAGNCQAREEQTKAGEERLFGAEQILVGARKRSPQGKLPGRRCLDWTCTWVQAHWVTTGCGKTACPAMQSPGNRSYAKLARAVARSAKIAKDAMNACGVTGNRGRRVSWRLLPSTLYLPHCLGKSRCLSILAQSREPRAGKVKKMRVSGQRVQFGPRFTDMASTSGDTLGGMAWTQVVLLLLMVELATIILRPGSRDGS